MDKNMEPNTKSHQACKLTERFLEKDLKNGYLNFALANSAKQMFLKLVLSKTYFFWYPALILLLLLLFHL